MNNMPVTVGQNFSVLIVLWYYDGFVLVYRDTPGERLSGLVRHSVHSSVTMMRTPLLSHNFTITKALTKFNTIAYFVTPIIKKQVSFRFTIFSK
jgi:hypothetical protein